MAIFLGAALLVTGCSPTGCSRQATPDDEPASKASIEAAVVPPPPPPFVDCTADEQRDVAAGISAWVNSHDNCVVNRTSVETTVASCKKETATGYIEARGTANYSDTLVDNTDYSIEVVGKFGPTGAPVESSLNASPNQAFQSACKLKGLIDGLSSHSNASN
jgi:hypothetical protein